MFDVWTDIVSCWVVDDLTSAGVLFSWTYLATKRDIEWKTACNIRPTNGSTSCESCVKLFQTSSLLIELFGNGVNSPCMNAFVCCISYSHVRKNDGRFEQIFGTSSICLLLSRALQNEVLTSLSIQPKTLHPAILKSSVASWKTDFNSLLGSTHTSARNSVRRLLRKYTPATLWKRMLNLFPLKWASGTLWIPFLLKKAANFNGCPDFSLPWHSKLCMLFSLIKRGHSLVETAHPLCMTSQTV